MRHDGRPGIKVVVAAHRKPAKPGTLSNILKKAGVSVEELRRLL